MAISTLNTFFAKHHRIVFGVFSVIIIIAFIDFLTPGTGIVDAIRGRGSNADAGEVFGRTVSYQELSSQMQLDMLAAQVFMEMRFDSSMREQLEMFSFYSLAQLEAAKRAGLSVSDEEVSRFLRIQFLDKDGKFNQDAYLNFIDNYLAREGFSEDDLIQATRNYLLINKLQRSFADSLVVTPGEAELLYNMLNERFTVLVADFKAADWVKKTEVVKAELDEYFSANRQNYVIPAQMQALVIACSYNDFEKQARTLVKDADVKAFYDKNPQLFQKDGKVEAFDKVKANARVSAVAAQARELAISKIQQFGEQVYEAIGNAPADQRLAIFQKAAADAKLKVQATGRFAADAKSAGKIAEPKLVAEIAGTFMDVPLTNAVPGDAAVYMAYVTEYVPSREAEFKEVEKRVTADYLQSKSLQMARDAAYEASQALLALPEAGRAAKAKTMKAPQFKAVKPFTLQNGADAIANAGVLANMQTGDVSAPIPTVDGAQVVVLELRQAPEKPYAATPEMEMLAGGYKASLMQEEFESFLAANCKRYAQPAESEAQAE